MKRCMTGMICLLWLLCSMTAMAGGTAQIPVTCQAPGMDEAFAYELVKGGTVVQTLELGDGESGSFTVAVGDVGSTEYTVRQKAGENGDATYDGRMYTAIVYAEYVDGELTAEPVVYLDRDGGKLSGCTFVNSVRVPEPDRPQEPSREEPEATPEPVPTQKPKRPVVKDDGLIDMPDDDTPLALPTDRQTGVEAKTALFLKGAMLCGLFILGSALLLVIGKHKEEKDDEI